MDGHSFILLHFSTLSGAESLKGADMQSTLSVPVAVSNTESKNNFRSVLSKGYICYIGQTF